MFISRCWACNIQHACRLLCPYAYRVMSLGRKHHAMHSPILLSEIELRRKSCPFTFFTVSHCWTLFNSMEIFLTIWFTHHDDKKPPQVLHMSFNSQGWSCLLHRSKGFVQTVPPGARPPRWEQAVTEQVVGGSSPTAAQGIGMALCPGLRQYWRHGQRLHGSSNS